MSRITILGHHGRWVSGLLLVVLVVLVVGSCEEKKMPGFAVSDNLALFIETEEKARDLFRWHDLIDQTPYQWPGIDDIYYDSMIEHSRHYLTLGSESAYDYGSVGFGDVFEAVILVTDSFVVRNFRISGVDTTHTDRIRFITRAGFFLQLAGSTYYYGGWELWGFGYYGGFSPPVEVSITPEEGPSYPGDYAQYELLLNELRDGAYTRLTEMRRFDEDAQLVINTTTSNIIQPTRHVVQISSYSDSGRVTQTMNRIDRENYIDTLVMSGSNPRLYDIILFQAFRDDSTHQFTNAWVVPYKIQ